MLNSPFKILHFKSKLENFELVYFRYGTEVKYNNNLNKATYAPIFLHASALPYEVSQITRFKKCNLNFDKADL